jgi:hypothetical protein
LSLCTKQKLSVYLLSRYPQSIMWHEIPVKANEREVLPSAKDTTLILRLHFFSSS